MTLTKRYIKKLEWQNVIIHNTVEHLSMQLLSSLDVSDKSWLDGVSNEIIFWWRYISERLNDKDFIDKIVTGGKFQYENLFEHYQKKDLKVLDIGCAITPDIGIISDKFDIDLTPLDPLGLIYNHILDFYKIDYRTPILTGLAEQLNNYFNGQKFDLIHARNSLDHCINVPEAFENMLKLVSNRGIILLQHFENEGLNQNYEDFHLWNITTENKAIKFWNPSSSFIYNPNEWGFKVEIKKEEKIKRNGNKYIFLTLTIRM